ncbi:MAG TPA: mechanosensitive ion channel domain-containing protein [Parafilimonas sp.]
MKDFLQQIWWGNSVQMYAIVLGELIVMGIIFKLLKKFIIAVLKKFTGRTTSELTDAIIAAAEKFILPFLLFTVAYAIIDQLNFTPHAGHVLKVVIAVITAYYFVRFINHVIHLSVLLYMQRKQEPPERLTHLSGILIVVKALVWIAGILMLIENLGYNITTIITGLGIGGIAIALAAQNILTDLFSYFVIFFDKPFEIGDTISVNNITGTVEHIGIKTSHIRIVTGEQLIMPNIELVKSTIKNIKRLQRRGINFKLNVRYDTPEEKLKSLPLLIKTIINKQQHAQFDRCHFIAFTDFSLSYEILYFIDNADYKMYLDIQQNIYLDILHAFEEKGIDFAFPGQTFILQHPLEANKNK